MSNRVSILKRLRSQTKIAKDWEKNEIVFETKQEDVGKIIILGDDTSPIRVHFYRKGFRDVFDPNLYKLRRVGLERKQEHANQPGLFRVIYAHEVIDKATSKVVGEVLTRLFRSSSAAPSWDLLSITLHGVEVYKMPGA
jgi:hypothetical protein